jgi:hypothetical protein
MNKFVPVVNKLSGSRLSAASPGDVVDPGYLLSADAGQQLAEGADGGLLAKGLVPRSAFPQGEDLCDWTLPAPTKTAVTVSKIYSDLATSTGYRTESAPLPMATTAQAGFMSGADKEALEVLRSDVDALQGKAARLDAHTFSFDVFSADANDKAAEEAELTAYALSRLGGSTAADLPDNISVRNLNGGHLFRFNLAVPASASYWVDDGYDTAGIATSTAAGIVKAGDGTAGTVSVDADGDMSVAGWSGVELTANRRTTLQAVPDNVHYPTEKLLADQLALREAVSNKVAAALSAASTDVQYPTAKRVYAELTAKENAANKTASLSASSTDVQYPSAKAVYDYGATKASSADVAAKQDKLSGTAGFAVTYTGTAGVLGQAAITDASGKQDKLSGASGYAVTYTGTAGVLGQAAIPAAAPSAGSTATTQAVGDASAGGSATTWS